MLDYNMELLSELPVHMRRKSYATRCIVIGKVFQIDSQFHPKYSDCRLFQDGIVPIGIFDGKIVVPLHH